MKFDELYNLLIFPIITEDFEKDRDMAEQWGFDFVKKVEIGDWEVGLFFSPSGMSGINDSFYQISLNRKGFGFIEDQDNKNVPVNKNFISDFRRVESLLEKWIEEYDQHDHYVGSMNDRKLRTYKKLLDRYANTIRAGEIEGIYFQLST